MIISSLFGYGQKSEHKIVHENILFYEFNYDRDKIYIIDKDNKLSVFDVNAENTVEIETLQDNTFEKQWGKGPFYLTDTGSLYLSGSAFLYKIKHNKIIEKYPVSIIETMSSWDIRDGKSDIKEKEFNDFIAKPNIEITVLDSNICILIAADKESCFFTMNRLNYYGTDKNKQKVESLKKEINCKRDESHYKENIGKRQTINYFMNKKIIAEEKIYAKERFRPLMSLTRPDYRYKIKISFDKKVVKLKDRKKRSRSVARGWGKGSWNCDMHDRIPNSNYISDKNGNIYLVIYAGKSNYVFNLIRIN